MPPFSTASMVGIPVGIRSTSIIGASAAVMSVLSPNFLLSSVSRFSVDFFVAIKCPCVI
jgi:hypothetical protein